MGLARTQNKRQMGRRCAVYFKRMALHVRRAPTNIGHPQTLSIHKAHPKRALTNIGHAQGTMSTRHLKSKDCMQSELGQQQFQVVAFWYFYVFSANEILNKNLGKASKKKSISLGKSPKLWVGGGQESKTL